MAVRNFQCRYKIYTKKEIDKIIDDLDIDLTDYYTKSEVDNLIPDMTDYYDKTETDNLLDDKQDVLTAGTGITIDSDNVISASGGGSGDDWTICQNVSEVNTYFDSNGAITKDMIFVFSFRDVDNNDRKRYVFFPKGTIFTTGSARSINFISESSCKSANNSWKKDIYSISITMGTNGIIDTSHWLIREVEQTTLYNGVITNTLSRTETYYYYNINGIAFYVEVRE